MVIILIFDDLSPSLYMIFYTVFGSIASRCFAFAFNFYLLYETSRVARQLK